LPVVTTSTLAKGFVFSRSTLSAASLVSGGFPLAVERLSGDGRMRVKQLLAAGGHGQWVISAAHELDAVLDKVGPDERAEYGIVLERNL
jgi:hypothetical protein